MTRGPESAKIRAMVEKITEKINLIQDANLRAATLEILNYENFFDWPASLGAHHGYEGGLAIHTLEVVENAEKFLSIFPQADKDVVLAAALWHDVAKVWDYEIVKYSEQEQQKVKKKLWRKTAHNLDGSYFGDYFWVNTDFHAHIHHIQGSFAEFTHHARNNKVDNSLILKVQTCILSHHGRKEWGSVIEPQNLEARIVSDADYYSAHFGATK